MAITGRGSINVTALDALGNTYAGASVEVRDETGLALSTVYSDRDGSTPITNPMTADANGQLLCYVAIGLYQVKVTSGAFSATYRDVSVAGLGLEMLSNDDGTQTTGTYTPTVAGGNTKEIVNGGAFTFAPPTETCNMAVQVLNNASAGAITTSGFTNVDGDALTTTNTHAFIFLITKTADYSQLTVKAMQ